MRKRIARDLFLAMSLGLFAFAGWQLCRQPDDEPPRLILEGDTAHFGGLAPNSESEVFLRLSNPGRRDCRIIGSTFC